MVKFKDECKHCPHCLYEVCCACGRRIPRLKQTFSYKTA